MTATRREELEDMRTLSYKDLSQSFPDERAKLWTRFRRRRKYVPPCSSVAASRRILLSV